MTSPCVGDVADRTAPSAGDDDGAAVAEQTLVGGDPDASAFDLTTGRLAAQLPHQLTHLRDRLGRDRLAEAGQSAACVHWHLAADRRRAAAQQPFGLALGAQADVLVPVELE